MLMVAVTHACRLRGTLHNVKWDPCESDRELLARHFRTNHTIICISTKQFLVDIGKWQFNACAGRALPACALPAFVLRPPALQMFSARNVCRGWAAGQSLTNNQSSRNYAGLSVCLFFVHESSFRKQRRPPTGIPRMTRRWEATLYVHSLINLFLYSVVDVSSESRAIALMHMFILRALSTLASRAALMCLSAQLCFCSLQTATQTVKISPLYPQLMHYRVPFLPE